MSLVGTQDHQLARLADAIAQRVGPTVGELNVPLDAPPPDSRSLGFTMETFHRPW